jgi:hypothetical protein
MLSRDNFPLLASGYSVPAAARRADHEHIAGLHLDLCNMIQTFDPPIRTLHPVLAPGACLTSA